MVRHHGINWKLFGLCAWLCGLLACGGEETDIWQRDTLTGNWFGLGEHLEEEHGISIGLSFSEVWQRNLRGGLESGVDKQAGSFDLELEIDLETLVGLSGGMLYVHGEGGWLESDGLDAVAVGSLSGINGDETTDRGLDLVEVWYEQSLLDGRVVLRAGKMDVTCGFECKGCPACFDANRFANDETAQFLNGFLINNPTIPFPDYGLAVAAYLNPAGSWYIGLAAADAEANGYETGFRTAFDGEDAFFYIAETGIVPTLGELSGSYRVGYWYNDQSIDRLDGSGIESADDGVYLSIDQDVWRENGEDEQGLGVFARLGWADGDVREIDCFASCGAQYCGLIPGRDSDVLGIGWARSCLSGDAGYSASNEEVIEVYYNIEIAPWLQVAPDFQCIHHPGGDDSVDTALVAGVRLQAAF